MADFNLWTLFQNGGAFMWPLLALSVLSLIIILERVIFFSIRAYKFRKSLETGTQGEIKTNTSNPLLKVIYTYRKGLSLGEEHCFNVSSREASRQIIQHERGLKMLSTIGAISPLIGLLGTVWGMVKAFASMAALGDKVSTSDFADGIWTGLLTTVAGLLVAIPAVTASRILESRVDRLNHDLNELASHLKEIYTK